MQRVAIIDYGSGNLHSAAKAFERAARESDADAQILVTADPKDVATADRIVLPGVGAFADCKRGLEAVPGMREALETAVREQGRPFLGICVGMQLMATRGLEFEVTDGLELDRGRGARHRARRSQPEDPAHGLEHAAASSPRTRCSTASRPGPDGLHAYFVHSYQLVPESRSAIVARDRLRRAGHRDGRQGQHGRHAVPPREEPDARPEADRQLPQVAALAIAQDRPPRRTSEGAMDLG